MIKSLEHMSFQDFPIWNVGTMNSNQEMECFVVQPLVCVCVFLWLSVCVFLCLSVWFNKEQWLKT